MGVKKAEFFLSRGEEIRLFSCCEKEGEERKVMNAHNEKEEGPVQRGSTMRDILRYVTKSQDFVERRNASRLEVSLRAQYIIADAPTEPKTAEIKDISLTGCLLFIQEEVPIPEEVDLFVMLGNTDDSLIKIKGKFVRIMPLGEGLYAAGVFFTSMNKETQRRFSEFCFGKMYERTGLERKNPSR